MKYPTLSALSALMAGFLVALASTSASAAIWSVGNVDTSSSGDFAGIVTSYAIADPDGVGPAPGVTLTAWANTVNSTNTKLESAYMDSWKWPNSNSTNYDLGVKNKDAVAGDTSEGSSPEHSIDNNDRYDMVLFQFGSAVSLSQVTTGWVGCASISNGCSGTSASEIADSDMTVLAYVGGLGLPTTPTSTALMDGKTYANLSAANGWVLIKHIDGGTNGNTYDLSTTVSSSYWLIGAYNPTTNFGAASTSTNITNNNDYLKLLSVAGNTPQGSSGAPEPATLALLGLGLLGMTQMRRLRKPS